MVVCEEIGEFVGFAVDGVAASNRRSLFVGADVTCWATAGMKKGSGGLLNRCGSIGRGESGTGC